METRKEESSIEGLKVRLVIEIGGTEVEGGGNAPEPSSSEPSD